MHFPAHADTVQVDCTTHVQYTESNQHAKLKPATYVNCTDSQLIRCLRTVDR